MNSFEERTEEATPRRRARSHAQGMGAHSALAGAAIAILAAALPAWTMARSFDTWCASLLAAAAWSARVAIDTHAPATAADPLGAIDASTSAGGASPPALLPVGLASILGAAAIPVALAAWSAAAGAGIAAAWSCGSFGLRLPTVGMGLRRLASSAGLKRVASVRSLLHAGAEAIAAIAVGWVCLPPLVPGIAVIARARDVPSQLGAAMAACLTLWERAAIVFGVLALADVWLQRRRHAAAIRMTPREVKEERFQTEGRPESKQRRRAIGARRARGLRIAAIRRATAVITNPEHLAVALRYAPPLIDVPVVVARGAGLLAPIVRRAASSFGVPIVRAPELARLLYWEVEIDEPIPQECYAAVAAVFGWIVRTRGALRRGDEPDP